MPVTTINSAHTIRPMVVTRKVWGGNRTANGARTQSVLLSILQTCRQQNRPVKVTKEFLHSVAHTIAETITNLCQ